MYTKETYKPTFKGDIPQNKYKFVLSICPKARILYAQSLKDARRTVLEILKLEFSDVKPEVLDSELRLKSVRWVAKTWT